MIITKIKNLKLIFTFKILKTFNINMMRSYLLFFLSHLQIYTKLINFLFYKK